MFARGHSRPPFVFQPDTELMDTPCSEKNKYIVSKLPEHEHKEIAVDPKVFDGYVGIWQLGDFKMTIAREGDRLFAQVRDQKISLSPESARDYVLKGTDNHLTFSIDRNGRPELILRESGIDAYLNR